jgi:hypothetical protein
MNVISSDQQDNLNHKLESSLKNCTESNKVPQYSIDDIAKLSIFDQNPKLLNKLKLDLANDNFYEAHQLFKTIHFR